MHIPEDTIKKVALAFLKGYYKYRPRGEGKTIARLDMMAPGGIVADGHLTFSKEDGSPFLATFEATSYHSREEVMYHKQPVLQNMDAFTAGMLAATLLLGVLYAEKWPYFEQLGKYSTILIYLFSVAVVFLTVRLLAGGLPRYRYLYAIEQFRQYHADQQWIALGEDVFPDPSDKNFKELKEQCVKEGFGLLMVDPEGKAYLVITPARVEEEKKRRRIVRFEDAQDWTRKRVEQIQSKLRWKKYLPAALHRWVELLQLPDFSFRRFQRSYTNQLIVIAAAGVVSIAMLYDLFRVPPVRYADEDTFQEELELLTQTGRPETGEYLVDSSFIDHFENLPQTKNPLAEEVQPELEPLVADTAIRPPSPSMFDQPPPVETPERTRARPSSIGAYDCDRFYGIRGSRYLVLYDLVGEEALARQKLDTIYNAGIEGGMIWMGCFDNKSGEFAVYLGVVFQTPEEAFSQKEKFEILLGEQGVVFAPLRIRPLVLKG